MEQIKFDSDDLFKGIMNIIFNKLEREKILFMFVVEIICKLKKLPVQVLFSFLVCGELAFYNGWKVCMHETFKQTWAVSCFSSNFSLENGEVWNYQIS